MTKQEFINLIAPAAVEAYKKYNILPSLTLAQAALESNWGNSAPGCMLFGIKWSEGCGYGYQLLWTREYINGKWVKVRAKFRKYGSFADSIDDHAQLLLKSRYAKVLTAKDYKEACWAVYEAGYATDPKYPDKLIGLIETYNLNRWDAEMNIEEIIIRKEGQEYKGYLVNGVACGEIRPLFESQGQNVSWREAEREVVISSGPLEKLRDIKMIVENVK
jgi:flagellum-specific peptidoglycan hydrolase FlgJ